MMREILESKRTMERFMELTYYHKIHKCEKCPHTLYDHVYTCVDALDMNCSRIPTCVYCGCQRTL